MEMIVPLIFPNHWEGAAAAVCTPLLQGEHQEDSPWVVFCKSAEERTEPLQRGELAIGGEKVLEMALAGLRSAGLGWEEADLEGRKVLLSEGNVLAPAGIIDPEFLQRAADALENPPMLAIGMPLSNTLFISGADPEDNEHLANLFALMAQFQESGDAAAHLSNWIFLVQQGQIIGHLEPSEEEVSGDHFLRIDALEKADGTLEFKIWVGATGMEKLLEVCQTGFNQVYQEQYGNARFSGSVKFVLMPEWVEYSEGLMQSLRQVKHQIESAGFVKQFGASIGRKIQVDFVHGGRSAEG